jgi:hypothetical protein
MSRYPIARVIEALRLHHGLLALAADELGCSRTTLYAYVERFPAVAEVLADERERLVDLAEQGLYYHLEEKSPWAIALALKTLGRERGYGDRPTLPPGTAPQVDGERSEWPQLQSALLRALGPYPEARLAVIEALKALDTHEPANGHHPGA